MFIFADVHIASWIWMTWGTQDCFVVIAVTAMRAIRLLTAEAKRKATLLRLCCADYERCLERLERLVAVTRQLDQDGAVQATESTRSRGHAEGGVGVISAHGQGNTSFGSTTIAAPREPSLPELAIDANAAGKPSPEYDRDGITENLRQILEQARSIRTKEALASHRRASIAGSQSAVAPERSRTVGLRPGRESCRIVSNDVKQVPVDAMATLGAGQYPSAADPMTIPSTTNPSRRGGSSYCATRSRRTQSDPISAQPARGGRTVANTASTYVTTRTTARSRAALPPDTAPPGATRCGPVESHSADVQTASSEFVRGEHENAASDASEHSTEVTSGLMDAILEESVRFMVSRAKFARTHAGCGRIGDDPHSGVNAAEDALLLALELEPSRKTDDALDQAARLDPHFAALPLPRSSPSELEAARWRDMHRHSEAALGPASSRQHEGHGDPSAMGTGWLRKRGSGRWDDVEQVQRSLLMLLDEVEGGRQVAAASERLSRREKTIQGLEGGERDHAGGDLPRRDLEDWYGWNKVAHLTTLLRQRFANKERSGCDDQASLSKEAAALVENPSLALTRENPLSALRKPEEGSTWQNSWQGSTLTWPRGLNDTACSILVEDLQTDALPCCPLQRNWPCCREVACEQTAISFEQQLRTTAILAAETDVSRLIVPPLARALSAASRQERPSCGDYFRAECSQTQKPSRRTFRETHFHGPERLPQSSNERYGANEDAVLWAPVLAVCRSVDAIVSGMGRPRMNFVRRSSAEYF